MTAILVRHKVQDYAKWRSCFDGLDSFHKEKGVKSAQVLRSVDNPNEVIVITEFENVDMAHKFGQLPGLKDAMQKAGVVDQPSIYFLDKVATRSFA